MNTIHEIGLQNQQDFWAMLYMYVGRSILDVCGRRGEKAVRLAVREMAREKGKKLASSYREQGVKTNLETLFAGGNHCSDDPRVRMEVLRRTRTPGFGRFTPARWPLCGWTRARRDWGICTVRKTSTVWWRASPAASAS